MKKEEKLFKLFEYQKFERNSHLDEIISNSIDNETFELNDQALFAAVGGQSEEKKTEDIVGKVFNVTGGIHFGKKVQVVSIKNNSVVVFDTNDIGINKELFTVAIEYLE